MNQDMIERYVAGRLGKEEAEAFEAFCVANPDFARQVELEQRLREGIREVGAGNSEEFIRSDRPAFRGLLLAASAAILAIIGIWSWRRPQPSTAPQLLAAVTGDSERDGPSLRLAALRGQDSAPSLNSGVVRVEIAGLFDTSAHYSVSLDRLEQHKDVETLATLYGQHPVSPMALEVMVDGDRLTAGTYSLRVEKQASDEDPLDFGFRKD